MARVPIPLVLACVLLPLLLVGRSTYAADRPDPDRARTEILVTTYEAADAWPVRALALLSLGDRWHPAGAAIVLDALQDRDARLTAYAIEALRSSSVATLRAAFVTDLVDDLIRQRLRLKNPLIQARLLILLKRVFPQAGAASHQDWLTWWSRSKAEYAPAPWEERPAPPLDPYAESKTVPAPGIVRRALDLSQGGLQVVLVLDSTGSMQPTIDATRDGLHDVVSILSGLSKDFMLGLVHYRDFGDFSGRTGPGQGAERLAALSKEISKVKRRLDRLTAGGGGDWAERVTAGLHVALDRKMGWKAHANKMVFVVGDAPPHELVHAADLAHLAHTQPDRVLAGLRSAPTTPSEEPRTPTRPFLISTMAVGNRRIGLPTASAFQRIARAGGGVYAAFDATNTPRAASAAIVRRLIEASFGQRYVKQARRLVDVFFLYRDAGWIDD